MLTQPTPIPAVTQGRIERLDHFPSALVTPRPIDVWLPDGYPAQGAYAVLYMHDGQMLFDATTTWNRQAWGAAEVAGTLIRQGLIRPSIIVGIWNAGTARHADYFPQKAIDLLAVDERRALEAQARQGEPALAFLAQLRADRYLQFITQELKPLIDQRYATRPDAAHTVIAGSSMGGLISLYALCEYPAIFGGAACLSTHWVGTLPMISPAIPAALVAYVRQSLPDPATHRLYFDYGTEGLDALYEPYQREVDQIVMNRGYGAANWQTHKVVGADHSEAAWQQRLALPLTFLLAA